MILEDWIPCIHLVYEFDPTFKDIFSREMIQHRANVFVSPLFFCDYMIVPGPLCEKLDDEYVILRLRTRKEVVLDEKGDWSGDVRPFFMSIEYFQKRDEWKKKVATIKNESERHLGYLNPQSFRDLYEFNFMIRGTP